MKANRIATLLLLMILSTLTSAGQAIKPDEFEKEIIKPAIQLLDVRTAAEYKTGYIKNALLADWTDQKQFEERTKYLDKKRPLYVYCLSGGRSNAASEWLIKNGFTKVYSLKGGINAWKTASKPLEAAARVKETSMAEYQQYIKTGTVLVDFGATWCPPCRKMEPVLAELKSTTENYILQKMDAGIELQLMKSLNISELPTFIVYRDGVETWRKSGLATLSELQTALKK